MKNNLSPRRSPAPLYALCGLAFAFTAVLWLYTVPLAAGDDQSCYFAAGRFIAANGSPVYRDFLNFETTGNFWAVNNPEANQIYPVYPPGYPALLAAARRLGGEGAEYYLPLLCVPFIIFSMYGLARHFLSPPYALLAAFVLTSSPVLFLNAQILNTHAPSLLLTLLGFWAMAGTVKAAGAYRRAALCGLLLSAGITLRYTEGLLLLVPIVYWLFSARLRPPARRGKILAVYLLAVALPLLALAGYQTLVFGAPWRTGYSLFGAAGGSFSPAFFFANLSVYLPGLFNYGLGPAAVLLLLAGIAGREKRRRWLWLAWIAPLFVLYHFYFWAATDSYHLTLRFWLNILPAMIIAGVLAAKRILRTLPLQRRQILIGVFAAVQILWAVKFITPAAENNFLYAQIARRQLEFLTANVPAGALIFFTPGKDESDRTIYVEALFARNGYHFFSDQLLTPAAARRNAADILTAETAGEEKARTVNLDRYKNLLARNNEEIQGEMLTLLRRAEAEGRPVYYFGNINGWTKFRTAGQAWFTLDRNIVGDLIVPGYLMFPQHRREHNTESRPLNIYPPLVATPLQLRAAAPIFPGENPHD